MDESPLLSNEVKEYINIHQIEKTMNKALNSILLSLPSDPYSAFIDIFKNNCNETITIKKIKLSKETNIEFKAIPILNVSLLYKGLSEEFKINLPISFSQYSNNEELIDKLNTLYEENLEMSFANNNKTYNYNNIVLLDNFLETVYHNYEKNNLNINNTNGFLDVLLVKNLVFSVSLACNAIYAKLKGEENFRTAIEHLCDSFENKNSKANKLASKKGLVSVKDTKNLVKESEVTLKTEQDVKVQMSTKSLKPKGNESKEKNLAKKKETSKDVKNETKTSKFHVNFNSTGGFPKYPNLGIMVYKCGKGVSKVKFDKFFIIFDLSANPNQASVINVIKLLQASMKKILTAGKLGENGFRLNNESSHFSPYDTINDTVKSIEEMIKEVSKDPSFNSCNIKLNIGIDCNANNFYTESTKKYEMDGMKKPPDSDELIDFYVKYCKDHPLITYLEDPLADSDIQSTKKMIKKFGEIYPIIRLSCKNLIGNSFYNLKNHLIPAKLEEVLKSINHSKLESDNALTNPMESSHSLSRDPEKLLEEINKAKLLPDSVSIKYNEFCSVNTLFEAIKIVKKVNIQHTTLWDAPIENYNPFFIDIGLGVKANMIVLSGINSKNERLRNILDFVSNIEI